MGKTVLISSHILPELAKLCTHATILDRGSVRFSGSVSELEARMNMREALTLRLAGEPDEDMAGRVEACVQELLGITPERTQPDTWRIPGEAQKDAQLLAALVALGAPVCDFHREHATLERVFMEVMRDEAQSDL